MKIQKFQEYKSGGSERTRHPGLDSKSRKPWLPYAFETLNQVQVDVGNNLSVRLCFILASQERSRSCSAPIRVGKSLPVGVGFFSVTGGKAQT